MIVCDFFEFFEKLMSGDYSPSALGAYPVRLTDTLTSNYAELSPYCSRDAFVDDTDAYVVMRNFIRENEQCKRRLAFSFVVLGRRFTHHLYNSYVRYPYYVRVITFEHCRFSLVMVTTIPRKK